MGRRLDERSDKSSYLEPLGFIELGRPAVPLSESKAAPGDQAFLSGSCQSRTGGSAAQDRKKKTTNTQKGLGDGKQGLHIKAPVCLTFNPRL